MLLLLPRELQDWIIDLALPPSDTRRHRNLRIRGLRKLALVHRTWTPFVQYKLNKLARIRLRKAKEPHNRVVASWFQEAAKRGWEGKQLEVDMIEGWAECKQVTVLETVDELWLVHPRCAASQTIPLLK